MATGQVFLPYDMSSAVNFRAWGEGISLQLSGTMGWAKTSDTGQVDWTTNPAVPSSTYIYEIWQPNDALQTGGTVFYVKLEYGFSATAVRLRISIGTGTNGSGTLTGIIIGPYTIPFNDVANQGATLYECDFSGAPGRLGMILWRNNAAVAGAAFIERTLAIDGTPATDGVTLLVVAFASSGTNGVRQQAIAFGAGAGVASGTVLAIIANPDSVLSGAGFNQIPMSPVFPDLGKFGNPMTVAGTLKFADIGEGALIQTTLYGATRTYLCSGSGQLSKLFASYVANTNKLAMRYD